MQRFISKLKHYLTHLRIKRAAKLTVKKIKPKSVSGLIRTFITHPKTIEEIRPYSEELAKELERNRMGTHLSVNMVNGKPAIKIHV